MLTIGTLLLFFGGLGAIAATTPMGEGALITQATLVQMGWSISIFTVIASIGAALIIRNRCFHILIGCRTSQGMRGGRGCS